jgi:hypothetical protein
MRATLCLEIGEDRLSAIELASGTIAGWFNHPLPRGMIRHGDPADPHAFGRELRAAMVRARVRARRARIAVPETVLLSRVIDLPRMRRQELARAIPYAVEREVPIPPEQCVWSWSELRDDRTRSRVLVIAGWRDVFERLQVAATVAGLKLELIEPRAAAVARCVPPPGGLVIDASEREARASVVVGNQAPYVGHAVLPPDRMLWPLVFERLLDNAADRAEDAKLPILLAGDLDGWQPSGHAAEPIAKHIRHGRVVLPGEFEPGRYVAPLGLSLWTKKAGRGVRAPRPARRRLRTLWKRRPRQRTAKVPGSDGTGAPAQAGPSALPPVQFRDAGAPQLISTEGGKT